MNNHLLLILIAALPDEWVPTILLDHKLGVRQLVFDVASILDNHFFHTVDARLIQSLERLCPNCESATHENVFGHGVRPFFVSLRMD